jgi:hypothetical protein
MTSSSSATRTREAESRERQVLPTAEQCEALQKHPHYILFKKGMRQNVFKQLENSGLDHNQKDEKFKQFCEEDLQESIKFLLENNELQDWQEFTKPNSKPAKDEIPKGTFMASDVAHAPAETPAVNLVGIHTDIASEDFIAESAGVDLIREVEALKSAELKTEAKDWREVRRDVEVEAVGDLHGSFEGMKENLKSLGLVREVGKELEWVGGSRKVVMIGDILADRGTEGMDIMLELGKLREQAEIQGGNLDILAGNHDDFFTSYLMGSSIASLEGYRDPVENSRLSGQGMGLLELSKYGSGELKAMLGNALQFKGYGNLVKAVEANAEAWNDLLKINDNSPVWDKLKGERKTILETMRQDPEGRKVLEEICKMKLAVKHDDTLFVHTNPANGMVETLFKTGNVDERINYINDFYQRNLRAVLLEGKEPEEGFFGLRALFLSTGNRNDYSNNEKEVEFILNGKTKKDEHDAKESEIATKIQDIRRQGVNAIVHGHTDEFKPVRGVERFGFPVISIDTSAFKKNSYKNKRSILKIAKDGKMQRAEKMEFIRE